MKYSKLLKETVHLLFHTIRPKGKTEKALLLSLFLYFCILSIAFCIKVHPNDQALGMLGYDTWGHLSFTPMLFSFDNLLNWNIRHPLLRLFYLPVIFVNEGLLLFGINITWPLFLTATTVLMSFTGLFVYKILKKYKAGAVPSIIMIALFCSFAHIIMLSIQVESFVSTMFFSTLMVLLFAEQKHNVLTDNMLFMGIAGSTSTNFLKFALYQWFEEKSQSKLVCRFFKSLPLFCLFFALTLPNLFARLINRPRGFLYAVMGDSFNFQGSNLSRLHLFIENFLSEPILFHHTTGIVFSEESIMLPAYTSQWYYLPITIIYILTLFSVIINRHHPLIKLFLCCFSVDLFMHFAIGYGMEEGQLFCGHWFYFLPIVIGLVTVRNQILSKIVVFAVTASAMSLYLLNLHHFFISLEPTTTL